jgi:hypothetical protein
MLVTPNYSKLLRRLTQPRLNKDAEELPAGQILPLHLDCHSAREIRINRIRRTRIQGTLLDWAGDGHTT